METKILKELIKKQDFVYGIILQVIDPDITESIALSGFDFIILDLEHTGKSIDTAYPCIMAAFAHNVPVLIRTTDKNQYMIEQALDAGCQGVLVPTVETAEDCRNIVKAAKYAPLGTRGYCPMTATMRWLPPAPDTVSYAREANKNTFVMVLIETPEGIKNLPEMLKVDGIDAFQLGPADYGLRVGKDLWDSEVEKTLSDAADLITRMGKTCISVSLPENFAEMHKKGAKVVVIGTSVDMVLRETYSNYKKEFLKIVKS
ncbi:MAG: hypothetical protein LBE14_05845 [Treponema sp.]|jgi:2-keto-3-deoxy-L-rhamnonate aldolase RhmA|nr:hypothetical protein [Treponema sp.]